MKNNMFKIIEGVNNADNLLWERKQSYKNIFESLQDHWNHWRSEMKDRKWMGKVELRERERKIGGEVRKE